MYKIEKDIPIPPVTRPIQTWSSEPKNVRLISMMQPGDSVFFEGAQSRDIGGRFSRQARRMGMRIVLRTVEGGVRMWVVGDK